MAAVSKIEWTDATFNPWIGCTKISPGCDHCYAEDWAVRYNFVTWGGERRRTSAAAWRAPVKLNARAVAEGRRIRVFCASLADVFDNQVPPGWREDLWALIRATPALDWLLLTKRPQNIRAMLPGDWGDGWPYVALGVTVEDQARAEQRIPPLLAVPAALRFLSCEPLLGPLDPTALTIRGEGELDALRPLTWESRVEQWRDTTDTWEDDFEDRYGRRPDQATGLIHPQLDLVIAGGESGRGARPTDPRWFRLLRDQCAAAAVPFLFKQWGEWCRVADQRPPVDHLPQDADRMVKVGKRAGGRLLDGVLHDGFPFWCAPHDSNRLTSRALYAVPARPG